MINNLADTPARKSTPGFAGGTLYALVQTSLNVTMFSRVIWFCGEKHFERC